MSVVRLFIEEGKMARVDISIRADLRLEPSVSARTPITNRRF